MIEFIEDGMVFDVSSIRGAPIKEADEYSGVRVIFDAYLGDSKIPNLQVDIGVGDSVYPQPKEEVYQGLLDLPKAHLRIYPVEAILAEKIHALEKHGYLNSRMKDIYDIWYIASNQKINGKILTKALQSTFTTRQTPFPESLVIFEEDYVDQRRITAWNAIGKKLHKNRDLPELVSVLERLQSFLIPIMKALYQDKEFVLIWNPSKGWGWH